MATRGGGGGGGGGGHGGPCGARRGISARLLHARMKSPPLAQYFFFRLSWRLSPPSPGKEGADRVMVGPAQMPHAPHACFSWFCFLVKPLNRLLGASIYVSQWTTRGQLPRKILNGNGLLAGPRISLLFAFPHSPQSPVLYRRSFHSSRAPSLLAACLRPSVHERPRKCCGPFPWDPFRGSFTYSAVLWPSGRSRGRAVAHEFCAASSGQELRQCATANCL